MIKFICGIRHKDSKVIFGLSVVDDFKHWHNDIKAMLKSNPNSSFALFPSDYEIVYKEIKTDEVDFNLLSLPADCDRV